MQKSSSGAQVMKMLFYYHKECNTQEGNVKNPVHLLNELERIAQTHLHTKAHKSQADGVILTKLIAIVRDNINYLCAIPVMNHATRNEYNTLFAKNVVIQTLDEIVLFFEDAIPALLNDRVIELRTSINMLF